MTPNDAPELDERAELEAYISDRLIEFRLERGGEISDEHTKTEIVVAILVAHREWWPRTIASITKARQRIDEAEFAESVFHTGRAFDGYIKNVLTLPVQTAIVSRISRSIPEGITVKADSIFKCVSGVGSAAAFCDYAISLVSASTAAADSIISDLKRFINGSGLSASWRERDRAFHAPIEVAERTARDLHFNAQHILHRLLGEIEPLLPDFNVQFERVEFSFGRIEVLHSLGLAYDIDSKAYHEADEIQTQSCQAGAERERALRDLVFLRHIEERKYTAGELGEKRLYRMTQQGSRFYRDEVVRRLPFFLTRTPDTKYWERRDFDTQCGYTSVRRSALLHDNQA